MIKQIKSFHIVAYYLDILLNRYKIEITCMSIPTLHLLHMHLIQLLLYNLGVQLYAASIHAACLI